MAPLIFAPAAAAAAAAVVVAVAAVWWNQVPTSSLEISQPYHPRLPRPPIVSKSSKVLITALIQQAIGS